ncbi:Allergen Asp f 7 [Lentinula edodes]|uniref:Allergen Asp f 7 n=1 Tax=Lentinula edodes TaxID=5353 RepID=A0A1Q3EMX0_LENED|nr:Allergen Asp f 7 [Lentinula edodes]
MFSSKIAAAAIILALPFTSFAEFHGHARQNRHHEIAKRDPGNVEVFKRDSFSNARWTFFADGLGACGTTNSPSDFIVALNSEQYGSGGYCYQMITMTYNGKTTTAQITDECPGCPYGGLDLSTGLFEFFADESWGFLFFVFCIHAHLYQCVHSLIYLDARFDHCDTYLHDTYHHLDPLQHVELLVLIFFVVVFIVLVLVVFFVQLEFELFLDKLILRELFFGRLFQRCSFSHCWNVEQS